MQKCIAAREVRVHFGVSKAIAVEVVETSAGEFLIEPAQLRQVERVIPSMVETRDEAQQALRLSARRVVGDRRFNAPNRALTADPQRCAATAEIAHTASAPFGWCRVSESTGTGGLAVKRVAGLCPIPHPAHRESVHSL